MFRWIRRALGLFDIDVRPLDPLSVIGLMNSIVRYPHPPDTESLSVTADNLASYLPLTTTLRRDFDAAECFERVRNYLAGIQATAARGNNKGIDIVISSLAEAPDPYPAIEYCVPGRFVYLTTGDSRSIRVRLVRSTDELQARRLEAYGVASDGAAYIRECRERRRRRDIEEELLGLPPGWAEARARRDGRI
ncbi:MAG: hypothetical protein U1D55_02525 [Phycisphaerae bacterium]